LANLRDNPEFALLDLTRAIELDANDRSLLVDRARAFRLLSRHREAAADLQAYLRHTRGEPPDLVHQARTLLERVEAGGGLRLWEF
jgi:regulator of sirC expression with transglutaminase-like and TPR domain